MLLGWRPKEFWEATPAELAAILALNGGAEVSLDRAEIEKLKRRFPD